MNKFTFEEGCDVPRNVLRYLNKEAPKCHFCISMLYLPEGECTLGRLPDSITPFDLYVGIWLSRISGFREVDEVVSTCPNLRHLSISTDSEWTTSAPTEFFRKAVEGLWSLH